MARQVLSRLIGVLAAQLNLEDTVDSERLVAEAVDCVGDLLLGGSGEVVYLASVVLSVILRLDFSAFRDAAHW